ncbi:hypothetical protein [Bacillus chungangensis]|uniref:Integral membrane protein n=1 Tax=Bacillus chungangensis TaxID=587633 RepID=A0ABT9WMT2_9BACI|nr:hypothetical protein [Bacillus chungangensis]MDQ0174598.1 putative integral membrane protein [Bacillus chungangensis]
MKKNNLEWSLVIVGFLLLLSGIFLGFVGAEVLKIPFIRMDLVPIAVGFCGGLLFVMGGSTIMHEKYKTKEQHIKENDERNITIIQNAKSKTFDLMTILFSFGLLALAMFGYMNKVSFFSLIGLFFICQVYCGFQFLMYTKKM